MLTFFNLIRQEGLLFHVILLFIHQVFIFIMLCSKGLRDYLPSFEFCIINLLIQKMYL
ncbi:hypothetical protein CLAVI_001042 [Candidatus Clavichlamydia salmonicola]|nr:hypothetical protein [Candidatus Clavichlamydia salmonicola]